MNRQEFETDLQNVATRLQDRIEQVEAEVAPLLEEISRLRLQLEHVNRAICAQGVGNLENGQLPAVLMPAKVGVAQRVFEILRDAGRPLHVSEIKTQYEGKGWRVPGQGSESNLLAYIVRDPRFARVSKGTYVLAAPGMQSEKVTKAKRKRRRRKSK
jgi:hypothetical protein